ncbi:MAG: hypothetical protein RL511_1003 [Bacteroidota bacterium]|jgi:uncharacterized membrane protein
MAYLHLLSNHVPILGSLFGILLLVVALLSPNLKTTLSAYIILLLSGLGGLVAYFTGEPAEESIEHVKGISHKVIHIHEEMAENSLFFVFLLTAAAIIGLWAERQKWESAKKIELFTLVVGIIAFILFAFTGYLGGHIRHGA